MNRSRALLLVPAAAALVLAGCSSGGSGTTTAEATTASAAITTVSGAESTTAAAQTCPRDAPADDVPAQWEIQGVTGSAAILGQTDTTAPRIIVKVPFTVDETQVETLDPGTGAKVTDSSTVTVCYVGVDGRDGSTFDSAYQRGRPVSFQASRVVPGFRQALVGQHVGSSVGVVMPAKDGYGERGTPDGAIQGGDSLIFALKILDAK